VQNQQKIVWPAKLIVAKAYLDQLERSQALPEKEIASLRKQIAKTEKSHLNKKELAKLNKMIPSVEQSAGSAKSPADTERLHNLAEILKHPEA
jgi:uncharacterized coiled-coil protein SlyX